MKCVACGSSSTRVVDSRDAGDAIRRRRSCMDCGARFTTHERVEHPHLWVRKRDGRRELLERQKLLAGMAHASRKRPIASEDLEYAVEQVVHQLRALPGTEVTSEQVGDIVLTVLRTVDEVAYVRFASVYKAFESVEQFVDVVRPLREPT